MTLTTLCRRAALALLSLCFPTLLAAQSIKLPAAPDGLEHIPLSTLDLSATTAGWGTVRANRSIEGRPLTLKGRVYESGVGTHGPSVIVVKLNGSVTKFGAVLGIDDEASGADGSGCADYHVYLQGEGGATHTVARGTVRRTDPEPVAVEADVNGWKYLFLVTTNGEDGGNVSDHIDWANAYFVYQEQNSTRPQTVTEAALDAPLATATTLFSQPGIRYMHKVRAASAGAKVSVGPLPRGLRWNAARSVVEGTVSEEGTFSYDILTTEGGDTLSTPVSLTVSSRLPHPVPFMGWISWNSVQNEVSDPIVRSVADLFKSRGLYASGWNTVMMDDWWHAPTRAADGSPQPDPVRFPHGVKALGDYVHRAGMRFGLYTDAAELTCAGAFGSLGHEQTDARAYADWGVDVVKCDYCSAPADVHTARARYKALADAFREAGGGTMLYICEWGVREPWRWGAEAGGTCWRVSYDVRDCWRGSPGGVGVVQSIEAMKHLAAWQGVNRFNDADMLCTGLHGTGKSSSDLCATGPGMTQDEYRTQFALWCMWSSPMALSFDPRSGALSDDDCRILQSRELIALNQDPMGQQADLVSEADSLLVLCKDLENGDAALSITNLSGRTRSAAVALNDLPALPHAKTYTVRDLWAEAELPPLASDTLTATVRSHATAVFRLSRRTEGAKASPLAADACTVRAGKGKVTVRAPKAKGMPMRVVLSDMRGHALRALTTDKGRATLQVPPGEYTLRATAGAQVRAEIVSL